MKSRGSQCNETLLVRAAVRPGKELGLQSGANYTRSFVAAGIPITSEPSEVSRSDEINYTTTLPCTTITMKITLFIITVVSKSTKTSPAARLKLCETVYLKTRLKCPPPVFTQARGLLTRLSMAALMQFCGRSSVPY